MQNPIDSIVHTMAFVILSSRDIFTLLLEGDINVLVLPDDNIFKHQLDAVADPEN